MYNFIYINTHDTGRYISPYGFQVNTSSLFELAKDGTLFTKAYSCSPTCSPSRASMLTSTMPHKNGMLGLAQRGFSLINPDHHLAAYLAKNGFETVICGIQHEVGWYFDIDEKALHNIGYKEILTADSDEYKKDEYYLWDRENALKLSNWLKARKSSAPFMISFGLHSTHRPYPNVVARNIDSRYVKPAFPLDSNDLTRRDQAQFLTSAQEADLSIGIVLNTLKDLDLYDKTIILFTTDHGLPLPYHKCNLRDDGIGVSMIFKHPKKGKGKVVDGLVSHLDVFPSVCEALNIEIPDYVEGVSFINALDNDKIKIREEIFAEANFHTSYEPIRCVRTERYKYIKYFDEDWKHLNISNIDEAEPKDYLLQNGLRSRVKEMEALYDCLYDPTETNNLIDDDDHQEIVNKLRSKLSEFLVESQDPIINGELEIKPNYKVNLKQSITASSKNPSDYDPRGRFE